MQRLYAMFPDRGPGLGLLVLRLELCLLVLLDPHGMPLAVGGPWPMRVMWCAATLLACGWLTPLAVLVAATLTLLRLPEMLAWAVLVHALALLLLGPGAYSIDARMFGRRVLHRGAPPKE